MQAHIDPVSVGHVPRELVQMRSVGERTMGPPFDAIPPWEKLPVLQASASAGPSNRTSMSFSSMGITRVIDGPVKGG